MKYRIIREDYFNEVGESTKVYFTIKRFRKFLWFKWWSYVKFTECHHESGCYKTILRFDNLEKAEKFVNETLIKNKPRERWHSMIMREIG